MTPGTARQGVLGSAIILSSAMIDVVDKLRCYAPAKTPVVLVGDTGTGKTFFARALHDLSGRPGELVEAAAGQLRPELAESDLYGHVKGAFTGALRDRSGLFAQAGGGTLLFDDFHLLSRAVQYMLLAPFDTGRFLPVGASRPLPLQCRLVIGIGEHPDDLVAKKRLLKDLRFRLGHCVIMLPRLEDRRDEIAGLAQRFLEEAPAYSGVAHGPSAFAGDALLVLEAGIYPGNLRDLRERIVSAYLYAAARNSPNVRLEHLPSAAQVSLKFEHHSAPEARLRVVSWALWKTKGHVGEAARLIGAHRNTVTALRNRLRPQGLGSNSNHPGISF